METLGTYLVLAVTTAPPLVPNAGILVAAGVLASQGRLNIVVVLLVVAGSAMLGDFAMHWCGRRFRRPVHAWASRTPRRSALLVWTTVRIHQYGIPFVIGVRFLPSGRLIGGLAAGITGYPARRYMVGAVIAESIWASYSVFLGYLGTAVAENDLLAFAIGFAISAAVAGVAVLVQRMARRREIHRAGAGTAGRSDAGAAGSSEDDDPGADGGGPREPGDAGPLGIGDPGRAED